jgi:hypothetical protein
MNYFELLERLFGLYERVYNQRLTGDEFLKKIKAAVPFRECKITLVQSLNLLPNQLPVAGLYDAELDEAGHKPIEMEISIHKIRKHLLFNENDIGPEQWAEFCIDFACILGHEFIHMHQFRRRDFKMNRPYAASSLNAAKREQQCYYGDSDELDAYAWSAAANAVIEIKDSARRIERTNLYKTYTRVFDKNDPVVLKFVRKGNRYLKKLEKQKNGTKFKQC